MMHDLVYRTYSCANKYDTIDWKGSIDQGNVTVTRIKIYSTLVHYLKSAFLHAEVGNKAAEDDVCWITL